YAVKRRGPRGVGLFLPDVNSYQLSHLSLRLLQPVRHPHLAVHRRRGGDVFASLLPLVRSPVKPAQTEMAMGHERAHAARFGERQGLAIVNRAAVGVEAVGQGGDVAQQMLSRGRVARMMLRGFDRELAQASRLVEPPEYQTGTRERVIIPASMEDDS